VTLAEVFREPLLGFCQRDYPEYWDFITGCLRHDKERPKIAAEYDGTENLMAAVESGLGVAFVTTHMARLFPKRARFVTLASAPDPVPIAVGRRTDRADDNVLAVFVEELRKAARNLA
jgi:DNA-binding transcriptional LysR family regulator